MSFHLEGPWLTTTGRKKGKHKFRNADEAKKARELEESWKDLQKKWNIGQGENKKKKSTASETFKMPRLSYRGIDAPKIPSLNNGIDTAPALKKEPLTYTGSKMKGIGVLHKSNAVPIFTDEEAIDIAKMRR